MFELLFTMIERLGIIVTIAFILTRFPFFRGLFYQDRLNRKQQYTAIFFFGFFGIIGTYSGLTFSTETLQFNRWTAEVAADEAIANSRVIGVVLAGLLGGYKVGLGAGLIAGIHRFTLGGFTGFSCSIASIAAGLIAGAVYKRNHHVKLKTAFFVGGVAEAVQMVIILMLSRPFEAAVTLVEAIGIPMIIANGLGSALFLLVIKNVMNEEEKAGALQAQKTLRITDQTLSHLRQGMTTASAQQVCRILYNEIDSSAVAITDQTHILAHIGDGSSHHRTNSLIQTDITKNVLNKGTLVVATDQTIHCANEDCQLGAAIIAPLKQRGETVGTLKIYFHSEKEITSIIKELIAGLSDLLSHQLEVAQADKAYQLAKEAEIKALQAQISPHFLFNSLNIIVSLIRMNPKKARNLLVSLSHFLRQNLTGTTVDMISLAQELQHVKAYLAIEEARFVDKLKIFYDIDEDGLKTNIPPLTLQPIVENSIKHGLKNKNEDCFVNIVIHKNQHGVEVKVEDNGQGMAEETIDKIQHGRTLSETGAGIGLFNVNRRLTMTFGEKAALQITSKLDIGTEITFFLPSEGG
ncbi:sensor histidine kinase [Alteribacillus sp. YIM 98480]|uniref:sensor histidine kinase n=1 Tax=Alteribacillus sp. YIM 98480 TaxID=2606599 RepID=UPI00131D7FFC|nr:sensor histidine kinase [Alteribacillus sp. YIM 98480]